MSRRSLTAQEAKGVADRKEVWKGRKWLVQPKEATEYRVVGSFDTFRKDSPLLTSDLKVIKRIMNNGMLTISCNPYLPADETDFRKMIANEGAIEEAGSSYDEAAVDAALEETPVIAAKPASAAKGVGPGAKNTTAKKK